MRRYPLFLLVSRGTERPLCFEEIAPVLFVLKIQHRNFFAACFDALPGLVRGLIVLLRTPSNLIEACQWAFAHYGVRPSSGSLRSF